jgi:hypothetical protein
MTGVNIWGTTDKHNNDSSSIVSLNSFLRKSGDTMAGNLNMGFQKIFKLSNPT